MYKKNKLFLSFIVLNFLLSCASFDEAGKVLKNEKIKTTDEFLVKKRDPLILPPDFKDVPTPGSKESKKFDEEEKIKKILNVTKENSGNPGKDTNVEKSILNKIKSD
tara:strand:+ start:240 stop:560 length:321 start_codon:yes stop_codon:yes gene_type:complete